MRNNRILVTLLIVVLLLLVTVPAFAQETVAETPVVVESNGWSPELIAGMIVSLVSLISVVVVVYIKEGSQQKTVAALLASVEKLNAIETAAQSLPPGAISLFNGFGKFLSTIPQTRDLGELIDKVTDGKPNEPLPEEDPLNVEGILANIRQSNRGG